MPEKINLIAALNRHVRISGEPLSLFAKQIRRLSLADRKWFKNQFAREFDYIVTTDKK